MIDAIERANEEDFDAVVILLDTPGGLASSMEDIYKKELGSEVPVIVYVSPDGAGPPRPGSGSARPADILAMAPQTNIGSSTPIAVGGEDIQKDPRKRSSTTRPPRCRRSRPSTAATSEWAEKAVREASNLTAREALEQNVIDVVAPNLPALLERDRRTHDGARRASS